MDDLDRANFRLRLDALDIDAGDIEGEDWEQLLAAKACRLLRQQINEAFVVKTPVAVEESSDRKLTIYSAVEKQNLVLAYLHRGSLPWYATVDVSELMAWMRQLIEEGFFNGETGRQYLKENKTAFQRFLRQNSHAALEVWADQWMSSVHKNQLPAIVHTSRKIFGQSHTVLEWTYALLFDCSSASLHPLWETYLQPEGSGKEFIAVTRQFARQELSLEDWQQKTKGIELPVAEKTFLQSTTDDHIRASSYFVKNAGLILLHPFLKTFFSNVHFLDKFGVWQSHQKHRRAVLLCHYLCTGETEVAEYALPLCKLLTGYPFHQSVEANLDLSAEEANEAENLLQAVIHRWAILKTTSPEGLQNSFLKREGKLSRQENGWLLQVEQKGHDILLSHLPWSIGVVKNGWMRELLYTEWT